MWTTGFQDMGPHLVKRAVIDAANGTIAVVAAVADKKIRVLQWVAGNNGAAATTLTWKSGSTTIAGPVSAVNDVAPINSGYCPDGHFETAKNEALNLVQGGTEALGGYVVYIEV